MKIQLSSNVLVLIGVSIYHLLFWQEQMGINVLFFNVFLIGSLFHLHPESFQSRAVILTGVGTFLTALLIVFVNSTFVKVVHSLSMITFAGFVQQRVLRFVFYAFLLMVINILQTPRTLIRQFLNNDNWSSVEERKRWSYHFNIFIIPVMIIVVFYMIYYGANPKFAALSDGFWQHFSWFLEWNISWENVFFMIGGLFVVGGLLWESKLQFFSNKQGQKVYTLTRNRKARETYAMGKSLIGLKNEYRSGWMLFMALNSLLFIVNLTDIVHVWFSPAPESAPALMQYVHEGTYLLILAILLAMGIILFLFRKNLNFFPQNNQLKRLAYLWLIQNAILTFSVGIRNFRYIEFCGLAYKRIGVILFLLLTLYGLFSLYQKVSEKRSFHFVMHCNAWALYALLIAASFINWDVMITRYNLSANTPKGIDVNFLMEDLSDKNLFLLIEAREDLIEKNYANNFDQKLDWKKEAFLNRQNRHSWLSWNWSDHRNLKYVTRE